MEELELQNQKAKEAENLQELESWMFYVVGASFVTIYVAVKEIKHAKQFNDFYMRYTCFKTNEKLYQQADLKIHGKKYDTPDIWSSFTDTQKANQEFLYKKHKIAFLTPDNIDKTPFTKLNTAFSTIFNDGRMCNFRNETPQNLQNLWLYNTYEQNRMHYSGASGCMVPVPSDPVVKAHVRHMRPPDHLFTIFEVYQPYIDALGENQYFKDGRERYANVHEMVNRDAISRAQRGQAVSPNHEDRMAIIRNENTPPKKQRAEFLLEANKHLENTIFAKKFPKDGQHKVAVEKIGELRQRGQYLYDTRNLPRYFIYHLSQPKDLFLDTYTKAVKFTKITFQNISEEFQSSYGKAKKYIIKKYKRAKIIVPYKARMARVFMSGTASSAKFYTLNYIESKPSLTGLYNKSVRLSGTAQNMALGSGGQLVTCVLVLNDGLHRFASERKAAAQSDINFMKNVKQSSIVDPMIFATLYSRYYMMDATEKTTSIGNNVYGTIFNVQECFKKRYTDPLNHSLRRSMDEVGFNHENTYKAGKAVREFVIDFITEEPEQTPGLNERQHSFHLNKDSYLQSGVSCTDGRKPVFLDHLDPNNNALGVYKR